MAPELLQAFTATPLNIAAQGKRNGMAVQRHPGTDVAWYNYAEGVTQAEKLTIV